MKLFSFSTLIFVAFAAYLVNAVWSIYQIWHPDSCLAKGREKYCLKSYLHQRKDVMWNIDVYCSSKKSFSFKSSTVLCSLKSIDYTEHITKDVNVSLPSVTRNNGTLYIHFFLYPNGENALHSQRGVRLHTLATDFKVPAAYFKLMKDDNDTKDGEPSKLPVTHWRPKIYFYIMEENFLFDRQKLPGEIQPLFRVTPNQEYLPIAYIDELSYKKSDLVPIPKDASEMRLQIECSPISVGKLRLWVTLSHSMNLMKSLGFTDDDLDEVKGIFTDTNLIFLGLTMFVSVFHILFDFLAFKNDISYWKSRDTMVGLSIHTVVYRCVSTIIIFLYLLDQKTSLLVLVPAGIGSLIEIWKVTKALKVKVERSGWKVKFIFGGSSDKEKVTEGFDHQAIKYLSYVMYPLCIGAAVYSLFYVPHKSWYSWVIQSLVNGVYAFGFLFMLPQLFINYKLKSVAHLPWKAFMYKAFNTFIDDVFAFIIRMPTSHRLACFRDDIVFFCYLYQLWLYPVDKTRVNEYGISYEEHEKKD